MAEQMRPASEELAPDTARTYERAQPEKESGMGRLDNNKAIPARSRDKIEEAVPNKQDLRQINAEETEDDRRARELDEANNPDQEAGEDKHRGTGQSATGS
ncbi:MAG TPA: hypothetical protein VFW23_10305 [Tepidisphaeraceae bacterium]|nr:hypothetical protein [Tepidisphaeraceae bacterium]